MQTYRQPSDSDDLPTAKSSSTTGCSEQSLAPLLQELPPAHLPPCLVSWFPALTPHHVPTMAPSVPRAGLAALPSSLSNPAQTVLPPTLYMKQTEGITGPFRREFSANPEDTQGFREDFLELI